MLLHDNYEKGAVIFMHACTNMEKENNFFMLPLVVVTLHCGAKRVSIIYLLETGSQHSYFTKIMLNELKYYDKNSNPVNFEVKTYLDISTKRVEQSVSEMKVGKGRLLPIPVLLDDNFNLKTSAK